MNRQIPRGPGPVSQTPGPDANGRFFDRAGSRIARALRGITSAARVRFTGAVRPELPDEDLQRLRDRIEACVVARGGEVSARAQAATIGGIYLELSPPGRLRFLSLLVEHFGCDPDAVRLASAALAQASTPDDAASAGQQLRKLLEPRRIRLLKRFNGITGGVKFLVDLHADLQRFAREAPHLAPLADDLRELLASWFDAGFLELRSIDWNAPAALLEKLIAYEAVHAIRSWDDLKNRLDSDRRCFAFFHPSMPDEPLIFVEVALVNGMAGTIGELLDENAVASDPETADTAVFYSISNAQAGLARISFGDFLIKRVVYELSQNFPNLNTFVTLSPIPGFANWLAANASEIGACIPVAEIQPLVALTGIQDVGAALQSLLADPLWPGNPHKARALQPLLMRLCARYLLHEKRSGGGAKDPVAHFHLSNGARVERINWLADISANGMRQSHGLMVNYLYKLSEIEKNYERYSNGNIAAASSLRSKK